VPVGPEVATRSRDDSGPTGREYAAVRALSVALAAATEERHRAGKDQAEAGAGLEP
jgi:hypothetical protein